MLDEDGLFDLIRRLPGKKSKYQIAAENEPSQVFSVIEMSSVLFFITGPPTHSVGGPD